MNALKRRVAILDYLKNSQSPISASTLAQALGVSRQIIVGDIALLRANKEEILSTPRGYMLSTKGAIIKQIVCLHSQDKMSLELQTCVDNGCTVLDVIVEHPVYGKLTGQLMLASRFDIEQFEKKIITSEAHSLSELTNGVHIHTLSCPSQDAFDRVCKTLKELKILY